MSEELRIVVHFPAAEEPFKDDAAERTESVGHLKQRVLSAFGLVEGQTPDGNLTTYTLYHERQALEDANRTLGDLAGDRKILQLKLAQQIVQG